MVLYHDINASHASRPLYDFYEIYRLCEDLSVESSVKIREIRSRGSRATGVLIWGCPLTSTFSAPLVAKLWVRPQTFLMCKNVLEVFYHLVVFSGARTLHGGTKKNKKLSYRRGTARRAVSVNVLGNVTQMFVELHLIIPATGELAYKVIQGHCKWHESIGHMIFFLLVVHSNNVSMLHHFFGTTTVMVYVTTVKMLRRPFIFLALYT